MKKFNVWSFHISWIVLVIGIPILIIFSELFKTPSDTWQHIYDTLLADYVVNTIFLVLGVSILTLVFGVSSAWIIATTNLPFKRAFEWLLIIPIAIPSYINGIAYAGLLDYAGPIRTFLRSINSDNYYFDIANAWGVIFVMSSVLFPYVYITARSAFINQSGRLLEASRSLGSSSFRSFYKIALPIARPAIASGLMLVIMEVLNDYGTVKYYGVTTFTTGIFRSWLSMGDLQSAVYLSSMLMGVVFLSIMIERLQRGKAKYESKSKTELNLKNDTGLKLWLKVGICLVPIILGFIIPLLQLLYWAFFSIEKIITTEFINFGINSFLLAGGAAAIIVSISILLNYSTRIQQSKFWTSISKISILGYSVPGAVIAVGIMIIIIGIDRSLISWLENSFDIKIKLLITGSIGALLYAYLVRYFAVGFGPIEAGFKKIPLSLNQAASSLGSGPLKNLFKINLPLLKTSILSALILVFVDVMKELPLTLILRPFNFETLATIAFQYANDEMAPESAPASLLIILIGMIPVILLNRLMTSDETSS